MSTPESPLSAGLAAARALTILVVDDPQASAAFYSRLLGCPPVDVSATFAMFVLPSGLQLGLWSRHTAEPVPTVPAGGAELAFAVATADLVDATCAQWQAWGLPIAQAPVEMDFGRTALALDPDGHRLRVFCPSA